MKSRIFALGFLIVFVSSFGQSVPASPQAPSGSSVQSDSSKQNQGGGNISLAGQAPTSNAANGQTSNNGNPVKTDTSNGWIAAFTFALVVVGVLQVGVYVWQSILITRSIDKAKESSERQLRAYISLDFPKDKTFGLPRIRTDDFIPMTIKNNGLTPAYKIKACGGVGSMSASMKEDFCVEPLEVIQKHGSIVLAPQQEFMLKCKMVVDITPRENESRAMYLVARVDYIDAFNVQRHTTVCYIWFGNTYVPSEYGNDAT